MTADDCTPGRGQESTDSEPDWEAVARDLLWEEFEEAANNVYVAFMRAAEPVRDGESLDRAHIEKMVEELREAYWTAQTASLAVDGVEPLPEWVDVLEPSQDAHDESCESS